MRLFQTGSVYAKGFWVVFFIGLSKMADMMAGSSDEILVSSKYYIFNLIFIIILTIISIGFKLFIHSTLWTTGAAVATLIFTSLIVLIKSLTMRYLFNIKPYSFKMLGTLCIFLCNWWIIIHDAEFYPSDNFYYN